MLQTDRRAKDAWDGKETFLLVFIRNSGDNSSGLQQSRPDQVHARASTGTNGKPASDSRGICFQLARPVKSAPIFIRPGDGPEGDRVVDDAVRKNILPIIYSNLSDLNSHSPSLGMLRLNRGNHT
jgi:hypothetical protein